MQYSMYGGFLPYKQCFLHMATNGAYIALHGSYAATYLGAIKPPWAVWARWSSVSDWVTGIPSDPIEWSI